MSDVMLVERVGHVAVLTLNRPHKLNALDGELRDAMHDAVETVQADDDVRAVVFTGAGRGFCSGADLTSGGRGEPATPTQNDRLDDLGWVGRQALAVYGLDKPVIAAVNGVAAGAGMSLALACDMRVGSEQTRFKTVFIERNLSPDSGMSFFLPRIVGYSRAADLIYTSRTVDAEEAHRIGLLDRLVRSGRANLDSILSEFPRTGERLWDAGDTRRISSARWWSRRCGETRRCGRSRRGTASTRTS